MHTAVIAIFEQVDVGPVGRIAFGRTGEFLGGKKVLAILALVIRGVEDGFELIGAVEYLLSDGGQLFA